MTNPREVMSRCQAAYDGMEHPDYYDDSCPKCDDECCEEHGNYIYMWLDNESHHIAKEDHFDKNDKLIIKKGQEYKSIFKKGLRFVDGVKEGYLVYEKSVLT